MNLITEFSEFKELKNIDRITLTRIMEDVFKNAIIKQFGSAENFDIIVNTDNGDLEIWHNRIVTADKDFEDPNTEIKLSEVKKIDADYEIGEEFSESFDLRNFNRRVVLALRQNLITKLGQIQKDKFYNKYREKVGEIITGEVYQIWKKEILVLDEEENELILTQDQMIPTDRFKKGDTLKAIVWKVEIKNGNPVVILSRTSELFLQRLFEAEVPEIEDGLITIEKIVRIPGERAKVAVDSYDDRIDSVGACIGMKGARIHGIVRELRNENIDVINWTKNTGLLIQRALSPAKIDEIKLYEQDKNAEVYLQTEEVSKAIGKKGLNIRLAMELTNYNIEVYRVLEEEEENDIQLEELSEEIEDWIIEEFKKIGLYTVDSILEHTSEELERVTDLEKETIDEVLDLLKSKFEEE